MIALLAFAFGVAVAGPEAHQCPVHDRHSPLATHHDATSGNHHPDQDSQPQGHCTCPQACCPTGISPSLPAPATSAVVAGMPVRVVDAAIQSFVFLPDRGHLLPFALPPPLALA